VVHQNQAQSRAPLGRGAHRKGHCSSTLTNEGRGEHPKGHRHSIRTNQPVPLGRGSPSKGHHSFILSHEPAPLGWETKKRPSPLPIKSKLPLTHKESSRCSPNNQHSLTYDGFHLLTDKFPPRLRVLQYSNPNVKTTR